MGLHKPTPSIRRAVRHGVQSANRSLPGMVMFGGGSLLLWLLMALLIGWTGMPDEWLSPPTAPPADSGTQALTTGGDPGAPEVGSQAGDAAQPSTDVTGPPAADGIGLREEALKAQAEARARQMLEWLADAWPILGVALLALVAGNLWLYGGQVGYVAQVLATHQSTLAVFSASGTRAFGALLGGSLIALLLCGRIALALAVLVVLVGLVAAGAPDWLGALLVWTLLVGAVVGLVWLGVRLTFWFVGIVVDGIGPLAALRATFRATRGRWWKVCGLVALFTSLFLGFSLVIGLLDGLGRIIGGPAEAVIGLAVTLLNVAASLYLGFVMVAAYIQFYQEAQACSPDPSGGAA